MPPHVNRDLLIQFFYALVNFFSFTQLVASADCAGALDVTDDLQHLMDGDQLAGLHCFRHLRDHVAAAIDSINCILSAEFMHASVHDARNTDAAIISKAKSKATLHSNEKDDQVSLNEEESIDFREHLLPFIIGLLRTAKLPSVLRTYRDSLTIDMKSAIKNAVAELLPVLVSRSSDSDFGSGERIADADGGGSSLASKLRGLSSESFVQLLDAIFKIVLAHLVRAAEVKKGIEWIMCNLDDHYAANSVIAAIAHGETHDTDGHTGSVMPFSTQTTVSKAQLFPAKAYDAMGPSNMSKNFKADVLRENTEAVFAACDAAHGRWAKLLGVRALLHPKLRLQDFLTIFNISQDFITATEKIGGRLGYSIRGTLQSQAKAFIEFQHESRMAKIKAVLDQETWVEVDVPEEFQTIVNCVFAFTSSTVDALGDSPSLPKQNQDTGKANSKNKLEPADSATSMNGMKIEPSLDVAKDNDKVDVSSSPDQNGTGVIKERGKSTSQALLYGGVGFHMVNCGLILLKMLSEYIDMSNSMPSLSPEIVHRVVEILKFFNTRTCQLVLGAGAMQVSGLKSITSKHLALASQVISFTYAIIPDIRQTLFLKVPETRKPLLLSEIDRVAQDFKVHRDEIHSKLVQIMRERLLVHLRGLPQIVESWNRAEDDDSQPSQFARSLTKEVGYLQRVLSRTLHESDVQTIFRQVVVIFHAQISDAFSRLELNSPQANSRLHRDTLHLLVCIRSLPTGNWTNSSPQNSGKLDEFLAQKFGVMEAGL
uniref:Vacuolar protein sorting-associated protein 54 C-terminal domain-containing protein n=1 Tax=Kalanchoe fedtschenkoi TaxID=63787 RepID=A0A7N0UJ28_KALFE